MPSLIIGKPGSGKTYLAVHTIARLCHRNKDLKRIYTDIEGFKFEKINDIQRNNFNDLTVHYLDFEKLYFHLKILYEMRNKQKMDDDALVHYCKIYKIYDVEFFIDEAHNHFDSQDKVLIWWFTYRRHFGHDFTLITQNKDLIHSKYRKIPEHFIEAKPPSHRLKSNIMSYVEYADFAMSQKQKIKSFSLKMDDDVFGLYKSGSIIKPKLFLYKMIFSAIALLMVFGLIMYLFAYSKNSSAADQSVLEKRVDQTIDIKEPEKVKSDISSFRNYHIFCNDQYCHSYKGRDKAEYPYQYFIAVLGTIDAKILFQRALYVYQGRVSSDVEFYVQVDNHDMQEYFPDFYNLRDNAMESEGAFSTNREDVISDANLEDS